MFVVLTEDDGGKGGGSKGRELRDGRGTVGTKRGPVREVLKSVYLLE